MVIHSGIVKQQLIVWEKQIPDKPSGLDVNDRLLGMIVFLGKTTAEEQQEMGAYIINNNGQIQLTNLVRGEDHEIFLEPKVSLGEGETYLGTFHCHPTTDDPSPHDIITFLANPNEKVSMVLGESGTLHLMVKYVGTTEVPADQIEQLKSQYESWYGNTENFAQKFRFMYWVGYPMAPPDKYPGVWGLQYTPFAVGKQISSIDQLTQIVQGSPNLPEEPPKKQFEEAIASLREGGPGSGNIGHSGVPGTRGGSAPGSGGKWVNIGTGRRAWIPDTFPSGGKLTGLSIENDYSGDRDRALSRAAELNASGSRAIVIEGKQYFPEMSSRFGIQPAYTVNTYTVYTVGNVTPKGENQ